ncbi:Iporin-like [Homarus americanus]|uniref:Iporin-like n=2 Tax=Homarus americanus TaxID=6706 RepID=A0A8J5MU54_HOMAM|nr:Iporin-like [Homarus americanus]
MHDVLRLRDNKLNMEKNNMTPVKTVSKDLGNKNMNKNAFNICVDERKRSQSPGTPKKGNNRRDGSNNTTRRRQDSGNSSSGYLSNRGSTEKIRRPSDSEQTSTPQQKPRPKPRVLKQMSDQCLQTSNLKVSAMVNTSFNLDKKEVYVYYPNYALPDLGFLKDKKYNVDARVFLVPQHYNSRPEEMRKVKESRIRRPFSCGDMEKLRKHGFGHIRDWDSLNFLLPKELKEMLLDETECMETTKPSFCQSPKPSRRPVSCDYSQQKCSHELKGSVSASSLNSTQPSSGFRGSSTMLNDSEGENGGLLDQRYVYKYDTASTDSEGLEKPPPLPKRSISLPVEERHGPDDPDMPPPRPPLPRGILRKSSSLKDDVSKAANSHNKRYSAIDAGRGNMREDLLKRRSLQEPMEHMAQRVVRETIPEITQPCPQQETEKDITITPPSPMGCSCVNQCTGFCGKGLQKKNLLRVSELPDVSSHEDLTEDDLLRIRSQVSNLLVTRGHVCPLLTDANNICDLCPKKSVSFAEKVCVHLRNTPDRLSTPPNSPDVSLLKKGQNPDASTGVTSGGEIAAEEDSRPLVYDAHDKKTLVLSVRAAVEKLVTHFSVASQQEKVRLGTSGITPAVAQLALEKLCPAVYALLSDGLHPSLHSLFGKINNSVWRVIEVTSQISPSTKALNDLVLTLNSEECLSEGPIKFNAFIFGLLNIRSLDSWLSYLRTRESVIQKHYHPEAFLYLSNTATKSLYDDLLLSLRPLALLPFNLDLLHEYKALHASLQKMEERLLLHTSSKESPGDRPPSVLDHLHSKETKEFKNAAQQDRVKALMRVLTSPELDENELLLSTSDPSRERSRSPRPRSCYEHVANEEMNPTLRKRWSGVQLGSRLLTAIDKLMLEEVGGITSSEDYTDSLDNPKNNRPVYSRASECTDDDLQTDLRVSDVSSRDGDVSERSASEKDTENEKGSRACADTEKDDESEGIRFRRLQLKWEQMAGPEKKNAKAQQPQPDKAVSPSSANRSRIPRPVSMTSPQRPFKPFEPSKEKTSPQLKQVPKHFPASPKELPKPAPRRSLKDKATTQISPSEDHTSTTARPPSVRSRLVPRPNSVNSNIVRASSVPGRVPNTGDKGNNTSGRYDGQRRYGGQPRSASHGRRVAPGDTPKLVQTLHHRLATDNGHLSFNRGDILTVVVEVDDRYLLCCHNDRKGLVPRASVIIHEQ